MESPEYHFRFTGLAHDLIRLRHTGWFTRNNNYDETARGVVYQMTAKDGSERFIAAMADPCNSEKDGRGPCAVEVNEHGQPFVYDDKEEAARNADRFSEIYAESEREDDAKQTAEMLIESKKEEIGALRDEVRNLIEEMKGENRRPPIICQALWNVIRKNRHAMHKAWKRITELKENHWSAVQS